MADHSASPPSRPNTRTKARLESVMHSLNPQSDAEPAPQPKYPHLRHLQHHPLFPNTSNPYTASDVKDYPQCTPSPSK